MSGVGDGRAEHQRRHGGNRVPGDGQGEPDTQVAGGHTPIRELRRRARRGDQAAVAELGARGVPFRAGIGSVGQGREIHRRD